MSSTYFKLPRDLRLKLNLSSIEDELQKYKMPHLKCKISATESRTLVLSVQPRVRKEAARLINLNFICINLENIPAFYVRKKQRT